MKAHHAHLARREALRNLMLGTLSMWIDWNYPAHLVSDMVKEEEHTDKIIRAFIGTIVPGADTTHPNITIVFRDSYFGFKRLKLLFTLNLRKRALTHFGSIAFHKLSEEERIQVIESGLNSESKISQLYSAAVFASQLTVFTGIYLDHPQCRMIDFNEGFDFEMTSYAEDDIYMGRTATQNGIFH